MQIKTENYEFSHGRKPKPSQHGLWMFLIGGRPGESTEFATTATYREACREVKAEAKLIGRASSITVCP